MASTKCVLRHPDSASARETRDTVFCQMRRAIDLIHFVIREGISADQGADDVDLIDMPGVSYQVISGQCTMGKYTSGGRPTICTNWQLFYYYLPENTIN